METYQLLQQAYGEDAMVTHKCLTGSVDLKQTESPLKVTPAQDDSQHRHPRHGLTCYKMIKGSN
jgi:hypothetical protein